MNRFKLFIENFVIYGLGGAVSKIIPFLMLPLVTRLMPNSSYYGINDIANVVVSFGTAISVAGMYDAMFRLFFEKENIKYKKEICSVTIMFVMGISAFVFCLMNFFASPLSKVLFGNETYILLIRITSMSIFLSATNTIISAPTRMNNNKGLYLLTNILSPIISYSISIPLLLKGYYVIALPLAGMFSALTIVSIFYLVNRKWFMIKKYNGQHLKALLVIALPLMPNFLIYWIFNSCDKLMITYFLGTNQEGIYAVASNIGHISQLIYTAFAGGWQFFAFSTMRDKDQVQMTSSIFEYLGIITYIASMSMMLLCDFLFKILFEEEYWAGSHIVPYLFIAPLLLMLFQVAANQFIVIKKTWPNIFILGLGASINIIFNALLIPFIGIEGAAIATLFGYIISVVLCVFVLRHMRLLSVTFRFCGCTLLFVIYAIFWRFQSKNSFIFCIIYALVLAILFVLLYWKDIKRIKRI